MSKDWVTVTIVSDEVDANLIKGMLESAGIRCIIEGNVYRPQGTVIPAFNRFKLNVTSSEADSAKKLLDEMNKDENQNE